MSKIYQILLSRKFFKDTTLQVLLTYVNRKRWPFDWTVPFI